MESGQILVATSENDASWSDVGKTLFFATQTNLPTNFTQANNTSEQEVTGLRTTLPIIDKTCIVKITFGAHVLFGAGNNNVRIRIGTSTSYLTNTEYQNLYVGTATVVETMSGAVLVSLDLSTETYVVVSMENDAGNGGNMSATSARTSVIAEVYA